MKNKKLKMSLFALGVFAVATPIVSTSCSNENNNFSNSQTEQFKFSVSATEGGKLYVTVESQNQITVTKANPFEKELDKGTKVKIDVSADTNFEFDCWNGNANDKNSSKEITISGDINLVANFKQKKSELQENPGSPTISLNKTEEYNVSISTNAGGIIYVYANNKKVGTAAVNNSFTFKYPKDTEIKLEPAANKDYKFNGWSDKTNDNPKTFNVKNNFNLGATFTSNLEQKNETATASSSNSLVIDEISYKLADNLDPNIFCFKNNEIAIPLEGNKLHPITITKDGMSKLTSLKLNSFDSSITSIGNNFLENCTCLEKLDLTSLTNINSIGNNFLSGCIKLNSLSFAQNIDLNAITFQKNCFMEKVAEQCEVLANLDGKYDKRSLSETKKTLNNCEVSINTTNGGEVLVSAENDPIKNINANSSYTKSFSENTELKINVKPSIGYVFKGWNNESLVSGNKEDGFSLIVREKNTNLIAFFVKKEYNISIKTEEGGTIDVVTDVRSESSTNTFVEKLPYDSKISICVKPNIGYMFTGWNDATYISGNEKTGYTISVTDNIDITAKFSRKDHNVLIHPNYGGTVTVSYLGQTSTNSTNFDKNIIEGTTLELTPCPDEGYTFAGWEGDTTKLSENKNGVYTVIVDGAINLVAKFTIAKCNVSILTTEHGKIAVNKTPNPTNSFTSTVDYGTSLSINVYPDSECFFKGWEGSSEKLVIGNKEDGFSVPVKDDINLTAVFEPIIKHKVTILNSNGGGTINVLTANDTNWYTVNKDDSLTMNLAEGSEFKIRVFPNDGYSFIRWDQKANIIKEEENSFIVKVEGQDIILSPSFQRMNVSYAEKECQVTVTSANMSGGRIGVSDNGGTSIGITEKLTVKKGAKIDIEAIPYEGYEFVCWNGISSNNQSVRKDINISYDREFVAYFKPISNYKHIEWDTSNKHELDAKYFTTVCDRVKEDANFYVDNNVICYYTAKNKETKYTDPATGRDYDVIGVCDASTWLDMGDVDAPFSGNNALNFTTCSELIDEIFTKEQNNIEKGYYTKADSAPRLGFVWAKNERGKWQPYVVKEILDNAFANAIFNPIHCNVIVPWTVEYVGNRAFEGASINNNIKRKKNKIYPIYTKRLARGAIVTWEYCKENNMTYIYDDDWAKPIYVTYDEYDNTWKVIDGDSRIPLSGGDGTDKLMPRGTKPSATIDNDDTTIKK